MIRSLVFAGLLIVCVSTAFAQGEDNSLKGTPISERIVFGGGLGLGFGNTQSYVMLSPSIGYMVTRKFMAGTNITYQYTRYKASAYGLPDDVNSNNYGFGPFARYMVYGGFFVQAEYEYLNFEYFEYVNNEIVSRRQDYNSFMAGGGLIQPIGDKASFYIIALYNFSYSTPGVNEFSPYSSPLVLRAGISLGRFGIY